MCRTSRITPPTFKFGALEDNVLSEPVDRLTFVSGMSLTDPVFLASTTCAVVFGTVEVGTFLFAAFLGPIKMGSSSFVSGETISSDLELDGFLEPRSTFNEKFKEKLINHFMWVTYRQLIWGPFFVRPWTHSPNQHICLDRCVLVGDF